MSDFAKLSRTTIQTLHHYDKIGLLSPVFRGENKYRYYSIKQLAICNTIRILQKLNIPLAEIKKLIDRRTPELTEDVLIRQIGEFGLKQRHIAQAQMLLHTILQSIRSGLSADEDAITIQYLPSEQIILGAQNDYSSGKNDYDALYDFYRDLSEKYSLSEYDICYPVWAIFHEGRIKKGDFRYPDRYYFYNPNGQNQRPAAFYAIGYTRAGYGKGAALYARMIAYIDQIGFEICGDAYEEYPLNEVGIADDSSYLMRVMITVREKKTRFNIWIRAFKTRIHIAGYKYKWKIIGKMFDGTNFLCYTIETIKYTREGVVCVCFIAWQVNMLTFMGECP